LDWQDAARAGGPYQASTPKEVDQVDTGQDGVAVELRERAGVFADEHVGLWVAVEGEGTLVLAGQDPAELFAAAADWLREGPGYTVRDVQWQRRDAEPAHALRLTLCHPVAEADLLHV
jgi:hypothetical protein